jgi:hypothetical protein
MKRMAIALGVVVGLALAYLLAHWALIETGREVIVLRSEEPDGSWHRARLWIVDEGSVSWLHGANSRWMRNLKERPIVEVERGGQTRRYRAVAVPGPHPRIHELLRAKYGIADRWVRFIGQDDENTMAVRLELLDARPTFDAP